MPNRVRSLLIILGSLMLAFLLSACDRAGANQNVTDWDICLDARGVQALDRWLAEKKFATYDLRAQIYHSIPVSEWLTATPRLVEGSVPETVVGGTVAGTPTTAVVEVEHFARPALLVLRDRATGDELHRRQLSPGYNTFKTFLSAPGIAEVGILYRGNLFLLMPIDWKRGRHQAMVISVTAAPALVPVIGQGS